MEGVDRILAAQQMGTADLLPANATPDWRIGNEIAQIPVVSYATAMNEPHVRPSAVSRQLWVPAALLDAARSRLMTQQRKQWQRFVAITVPFADAQPMDPLIQPDAIVLLDRHYNSLLQYRPNRPNVYAVRKEGRLRVRHADFLLNRLVLRPHNRAFPIELIEPGHRESPGDLIIGRVVLILNEH